ncbi:unnamed protein product [Rhizoctonia solani]|uniref:Zn(2)-C6 fungal-type domain-containing protein n=1 Tax=Rhizoctonia solani TaxID=456999 RepID=A0A8H2XJ47_9AGAM|nr:unnamed protein product [Rhizoctonia solani]
MQKIPPGPIGTSCLTCKRRHKKCDQTRPTCLRCKKGKFECLGYSHNIRDGVPPPSRRLILPMPPIPEPQRNRRFDFARQDEHTGPNISLQATNIPDSRPSTQNISSHSDALTPIERCALSLALRPTESRGDSNLRNATSLRHLITLFTQLPYDPFQPTEVYLNSGSFEESVSAHCYRMVEITYFKPARLQLAQIQRSILSRLHHSNFTRWIMFLCGTVSESFVKGDTSHNQLYSRWIADTEQSIRSTLAGNIDSYEAQNRLGDWLEILLLKTMVVDSSYSYQILHSAVPTFLRMVFSDPALWPLGWDSTSVPLVNIIASTRHELAYFALVDSTSAMAFGFARQIEYNTSFGKAPSTSNPYECVHGSPAEFQVALAEINACRDGSSRARGWQEIELRLSTWQAQPIKYDSGWESWMVVAWLAVQESWRHTLLAYLYMSVCGATSDDERVQSSVRQNFQVLGTVRKQQASDADGDGDVNVPCFLQYLMAGICARNEKHRAIVRKRLGDVCGTRLWLMRGADFVPVLDHLWHGAAVGGHPITWRDYLFSREVALPVAL